jgi:hypothetical protein
VPLQYPSANEGAESPGRTAEVPSDQTSSPPPRELTEREVQVLAGRVRAHLMESAVTPDSSAFLDEVTDGLYHRLRSALRSELIADRERAGVLTEFH